MSFMMKKKRFKFDVSIEAEELSSVPFVNAVLFAKLRLVNGGNFTSFSSREEVTEHRVRWKASARFQCKMSASATTGMLEPCLCRISVRKELKGGHSYQKLGFADINLSEYAGAGLTTRRYLLEGYDSKRRQDNSTLKVNICLTLVSGDPVFQAPRADNNALLFPDEGYEGGGILDAANKGASGDSSSESAASSANSGFGSLPRKEQKSPLVPHPTLLVRPPSVSSRDSDGLDVGLPFRIGGAGGGRQLKVSSSPGGAAGPCQSESSINTNATLHLMKPLHIRQSSDSVVVVGHREPSRIPSDSTSSMTRNSKKFEDYPSSLERRVDSTRVNADELIDQLFKAANFETKDDCESDGLKLVVRKDGTTVFE